MKIQAAVAWAAGAPLSIEELDLDDPGEDEILVRVEAVGVCHADDNARLVRNYPFAQVSTAIADSLAGVTIKPVLTRGS